MTSKTDRELLKIKKALIELTLAKDRYKELSEAIGGALESSTGAQVAAGVAIPVDWIKNAYQMSGMQREHGYGEEMSHDFHDDDADGYLGENCLHAQRAHRLIQERIKHRKVLGNAKRKVSLIGRNLVREIENEKS